MAALDRYVTVNITRNTQALSVASFSIPLLLATHAAWPERARVYSSIEAITADFPVGSKVHSMAQTLYSQQLVSGTVVIGRREADSYSVQTSAPSTPGTGGEEYAITVGGVVVASFETVTGSETVEEIVTALAASATSEIVLEVTDLATGTFTVTPVQPGGVVVFTPNLTSTSVVSGETYAQALSLVNNDNSDWFGVAIDSRDSADIEQMAAAVESLKKIFFTASADAEILNQSSDSDIASRLQALGYEGTYLSYSPKADTEWPDVANMWPLNETVGNVTWAFKQLNGVSAINHTEQEITVMERKNVNFYRTIAGARITDPGKTVGGFWLDYRLVA